MEKARALVDAQDQAAIGFIIKRQDGELNAVVIIGRQARCLDFNRHGAFCDSTLRLIKPVRKS